MIIHLTIITIIILFVIYVIGLCITRIYINLKDKYYDDMLICITLFLVNSLNLIQMIRLFIKYYNES